MFIREPSRIMKSWLEQFCEKIQNPTQSDKKTEFIENTEDDFHVSNPNPLKKLSQKEKEEAQVCNLA